MFQFPSNGKAHENWFDSRPPHSVANCFNSLQTGKRMKTLRKHKLKPVRFGLVSIPFKRESAENFTPKPSAKAQSICFNSLQTGKRMKTRGGYPVGFGTSTCFNSLQTGKRMKTAPIFAFSWDVTPNTLKPRANSTGIFSLKIHSQNPTTPDKH